MTHARRRKVVLMESSLRYSSKAPANERKFSCQISGGHVKKFAIPEGAFVIAI